MRPIRSKITLAKEKNRRKGNSEEEERRRGEKKSNGFLYWKLFLADKKLFEGRGLFGVTFSKIQLDICTIY